MNPPELLPWLGRLHPLVLHVPIGLLVAAALVEGACLFSRGVGLVRMRRTLHVVAALAAGVTAATGWWLAEHDGGGAERLVDAHRRLGIAFAVAWGVVAVIDLWTRGGRGATARRVLLLLVFALGTLAGHLGGALTHGSRWLTDDAPAQAVEVFGALDVAAESVSGWLGAEPLGFADRAARRDATRDGGDDAQRGAAPDARTTTPDDATPDPRGDAPGDRSPAGEATGSGTPGDAATATDGTSDDPLAGLLQQGVLDALGGGDDGDGGDASDGDATPDVGASDGEEVADVPVVAEQPGAPTAPGDLSDAAPDGGAVLPGGDVAASGVTAAAYAVLETRCIGCHGPDKSKGRLRLDTEEGLRSVVPADDPAGGELWLRVTLPPDDLDVMPPEDEPPLTTDELDALRVWIEAGAPLAALAEEADRAKTARADAEHALDDLRARTGARITPVTGDPTGPLRVDLARSADPLDAAALAAALDDESSAPAGAAARFADRVAELSLAGRTVPPGALSALPPLPDLVRLHLERTGVADADVLALLSGSPRLAYVNLHGTAVTDAVLDAAEALPELRRLVLLDTGVTDEELARFTAARPDVHATGALDLPPAPEPLTVATAGADAPGAAPPASGDVTRPPLGPDGADTAPADPSDG